MTATRKITLSVAEEARFWAKVDRRGEDECWPWMASKDDKGYGRYGVGRKPMLAHRVAWTLIRGAIGAGLFVCHKCDNPICCNPRHLFLGTQRDNMHDASVKGRINLGDNNGMRKHPERRPTGERNANSKLTSPQVLELLARYEAGERQCDLARRFAVSPSHVCDLVQGKRWGHLR